MKKYDYNIVKDYIENEGYKLLSTEYINNSIPLEMICPNGHTCNISFGNFKIRNRRCSKCYGNRKMTKNDIIHELSVYNYTLLSGYKNANEKILIKCPNNHEWITSWGKFQSGRRCPYCSGKFNNYDTIRYMIESEEGYELLTDTCTKLSDRLIVKCKNNHEYDTTGNNFKQGHRCPYCNESKGEKRISNLLNTYDIHFIPQYKFNDCKFKNDLFFDFYLPDYNTCIEYDGEFHYKPIMGINEFAKGYIRDEIKNNYCTDHKITLIRIPYWDFNNIENIIIENLNLK